MTDKAEQPVRKCAGADCDKDADTLQCPSCQKMGKESYFCSQDCFKRNWVCDPFLLARDYSLLTVARPSIRKSTKAKVTFSITSFLQASFLNPIQLPVTSIHSPRSHTRASYDLYILSLPNELFLRRYGIPITRKMEYQGQSRSLWEDAILPS
jgi:hypothetical protein